MNILNTYKNTLLSSGLRKETIDGYLYDINCFIKFIAKRYPNKDNVKEFAKDFFGNIFETDIYAYIEYAQNVLHNDDATIRRKISSLNKFYEYLVNEKILHKNIIGYIDLKKRVYEKKQVLLMREVKQLIDYTMNYETPRNCALIFLVLFCALTVKELVNLKTSDLYDTVMSIYKNNTLTKKLKISDALICVLSGFLNERQVTIPEKLFISTRKKGISVRMVKYIIENILKNSGVYKPGMSLNVLRNTSVYMYSTYEHIPISELKRFLGHKNITTTALMMDFDEVYEGEGKEIFSKYLEKYLCMW